MNTKKKIIVILGSTASGKTKLAVKLANKFDGEIVSADSRQVYKYMNIGSGKDLKDFVIKKRKIKHIPYHMIDIVSPNSDFNVAKYQKLAYKAIDNILNKKKLPIIVGGTGLYISSIVDGLSLGESKIEGKKLKDLRSKLEKHTLNHLLKKLEKIDPKTYKIIDQKNRHRVQRAVEIFYQTGKPKSEQPKNKPKYQALQIGIKIEKKKLHSNIDKRLNERLKGGAMTKEVIHLHKKYRVSWKKLVNFGLEYRWLSLYLQKKITYTEMKSGLARDIKKFAKRQMTWFKKDQTIVWENDYKKILKTIKNFLV